MFEYFISPKQPQASCNATWVMQQCSSSSHRHSSSNGLTCRWPSPPEGPAIGHPPGGSGPRRRVPSFWTTPMALTGEAMGLLVRLPHLQSSHDRGKGAEVGWSSRSCSCCCCCGSGGGVPPCWFLLFSLALFPLTPPFLPGALRLESPAARRLLLHRLQHRPDWSCGRSLVLI